MKKKEKEYEYDEKVVNVYLDLEKMTHTVIPCEGGYSVETVFPLKKQLKPNQAFRFAVSLQQKDGEGQTQLSWTRGRTFRDVSKCGLAICE